MLKNFINEQLRILTCEYVHLHTWSIDNLASPYWRLYWAITPGGVVQTRDQTYPVRPGTVMVIPPETSFDARLTRPFKKLYMHVVLPPLMRAGFTGIREVDLPAGKPEEVLRCAEAVERMESALFEAGARATALVHWAMAELPPDRLEMGSSDDRIDHAIECLQAGFPHPVPNEELAARVGMNINAFIRLFRQTVGETPQSFYTRMRVDQAGQMLHGGDETIDQVAEATGFCDRYHFSRVFKKQRGMGPAAFRKQRELASSGVMG